MKYKLTITSYPDKAKKLVDIWKAHLNSDLMHQTDTITFVRERPQKPKNQNRRIAGLKAKSVAYFKDTELISMSVENYIYLMAKAGVQIEIDEEVEE